MAKKILALIMSVICVLGMSTIAFADNEELTVEEIKQKGTLEQSEILHTNDGPVRADFYSFTEELPETRSVEKEYVKTVSVIFSPVVQTRGEVQHGEQGLNLKIYYAERSYADDHPEVPGYRLTRVFVNNTKPSVIDLGTLHCISASSSLGGDVNYNLAGNTSTSIVKYMNFSEYIADAAAAAVGAQISAEYNGDYLEVHCFKFNNYL
ncbi:unknown [Clostridium sp. CAG:242]|nr:unknown [Clostridium sp. CAG:242]